MSAADDLRTLRDDLDMWAHGGLPLWPALTTGAGSAAQAAARACWTVWYDGLMAASTARSQATADAARAAKTDDDARTHAEAMTARVEALEAEITRLRKTVEGVALRMRVANNGTATWDEAIDSWERALRKAVRP